MTGIDGASRIRPGPRRARRLRRNQTDAERSLWQALHALRPRWKFCRQYPVGGYVVDFACPAAKLAVELDGGQHATRMAADAARTATLAARGYRVVRFWNNDVLENIAGVIAALFADAEIVELTLICGLFKMINRINDSLGLEIEAKAASVA
ncbi:MAG: endonuclease domain-containing protein [Alphaproteobacteria bacterium]|nr:endonuclease domain-containing protein [Alphaproteobacteria bacterium]